MITVIIMGIFATFFAYMARYKRYRQGLKISFTLIFIFLALRYNFGNDYKGYFNAFYEINKYNQINYFDKFYNVELGWIFLNHLFKPFGFFAMIAVLALFNCVIYYRFIKKYVPINYYWLAVFLYIFNSQFMLVHCSAMRQSIAIALFILSIDYIYKKDAIRYFLCIGLASLFHTSALILIPVFLLSFFNWKMNMVIGIIAISIFGSLFIFGKYLLPKLNEFVYTYFENYTKYSISADSKYGISIVYSVGLFLLIIFYEKIQSKEISLIFKIAMISFMFLPLRLLIQLISRVGMYFEVATIVVFPLIFMSINKPIYKIIFLSILLFMTIYRFLPFFQSDIWRSAFETYQTIFNAPSIY